MKFIEWYYYLFYKFYKIALTGAIKSLADWYASLAIGALEIFSLISIYNYHKVFFDRYDTIEIRSFKVLFPLFIILVIHHFAFNGTDKWQNYVNEFDQWPLQKNVVGSWVVAIVVLVMIANIIVSYYLLSQVDWAAYRR
jgi:hypothetical protein